MTVSRVWGRDQSVLAAGLASALLAIAAGLPAVAEVVGGLTILAVALLLGANLNRRAMSEFQPRRVLAFEALLVLVVLLGLSGVTLIGMAIP